ncbi:Transcription initiation factor IIA subunit 2 [Aix galericulata]|nr:Transcription initiation factor IIA subunit 2 [Aix galericulata]
MPGTPQPADTLLGLTAGKHFNRSRVGRARSEGEEKVPCLSHRLAWRGCPLLAGVDNGVTTRWEKTPRSQRACWPLLTTKWELLCSVQPQPGQPLALLTAPLGSLPTADSLQVKASHWGQRERPHTTTATPLIYRFAQPQSARAQPPWPRIPCINRSQSGSPPPRTFTQGHVNGLYSKPPHIFPVREAKKAVEQANVYLDFMSGPLPKSKGKPLNSAKPRARKPQGEHASPPASGFFILSIGPTCLQRAGGAPAEALRKPDAAQKSLSHSPKHWYDCKDDNRMALRHENHPTLPRCLVPCLVPEALPAFTRELMLSFHGWGYASTAASPGKGKGKVREPASKTAASFGTPNKGAIEEASQKEGKVVKQILATGQEQSQLQIPLRNLYENIWTSILSDVEFREVTDLMKVDKRKIAACDGKTLTPLHSIRFLAPDENLSYNKADHFDWNREAFTRKLLWEARREHRQQCTTRKEKMHSIKS